jgi:amidase
VTGADLAALDACAQAELVRRGDVTPLELVDAAIHRIEAGNPALNAVIAPLYDRGRAQAASAAGPFAGVPMLLKDAGQEIAGTPHWVGTPVLHRLDHRSPQTTSLAARFEQLGFVILGKTNLPELSAGATTEPAEFGPTRNPWAPDRTAGGSSGGSAAAVAARWVPIAHGSDGTGSLRFPASACGVLTMKPSRGRVPSIAAAGMGDPNRLWCEFVLARSARDLAAVFAGVATPDAAEPRARGPLRVGMLTTDVAIELPAEAACSLAVEQTAAALEELGHHVERAYPPELDGIFARVASAFMISAAWARGTQLQWLETRIARPLADEDLGAEALELGRRGLTITPAELHLAAVTLTDAIAPILTWWDSHDLLVTPIMRVPPWPLGERSEGRLAGGFAFPYSFTGQPVLAAPAHVSDGLPVGVQLVGRPDDDALLLRLAAELEPRLGWLDRSPPSSLDGD